MKISRVVQITTIDADTKLLLKNGTAIFISAHYDIVILRDNVEDESWDVRIFYSES